MTVAIAADLCSRTSFSPWCSARSLHSSAEETDKVAPCFPWRSLTEPSKQIFFNVTKV